MQMQIDLVARAQYESLVDLLCGVHSYYNEGSSVSRETVRSHLLGNLLAPGSPPRLVVASTDAGRVLGFAAISPTYSLVEPTPARRRQCQLKELYVRSSERTLSVGKAIMAWVARHAAKNECGRIDWSVKTANDRGISFYKELGAHQGVERLSFRLSRASLSGLANQNAIATGN